MEPAKVVRIFTGAIVPNGCDAVIKREHTEELGDAISLSQWLVVMSSFVGRVETDPSSFRVTTELLQLDSA